ncbi:MAG: class I SAM-dependent methyltransferase [Promethearchaeota archaeon]
MNREAWNEAIPYHKKGRKIDLNEKFKDPAFIRLNNFEMGVFKKLDIKGKDVVQLCCNNGIELISIMRLGAKHGVGIDISDEAIKEAKSFASIAQVNCNFIRSDIYEITPNRISEEISGSIIKLFDILYISVGALCWLPDLSKFFEICASLLKPLGKIFICDVHPFANMLGFEGEEGYNPKFPMNPVNSYFKIDPWIDTDGIDYIGGKIYESKPMASFAFKISDILNGLIQTGIEIQEFNEYPDDIATVHGDVANFKKIPLCFSLIGRKK